MPPHFKPLASKLYTGRYSAIAKSAPSVEGGALGGLPVGWLLLLDLAGVELEEVGAGRLEGPAFLFGRRLTLRGRSVYAAPL